MEDVTEYEKLHRQLSLSENLSAIGLLAAGVAHEITNPLEVINYYMQRLKLNNNENSEIRNTVTDVNEEILSISNIIQNLLMFSESKMIEAEIVDLNFLLDTIIRLIRKSSVKENIIINYNAPEGEFNIKAVRTELKQVFLNIFKNSFEAIQEEGVIEVEIFEAVDNGDQHIVKIIIADNGKGLKESELNDLFKPFYTTKLKYSVNMGLGLSIAYEIVNRHDGSMSMKNGEECGCITELTFPLIDS